MEAESQWPTYGLSLQNEKCAMKNILLCPKVMRLSDQNIDIIYEMSHRKQDWRQLGILAIF